VLALNDDVRATSMGRRDDGQTTGHGLKYDVCETLK